MTDELQHFGVKGMKWGVRKQKETSSQKSQRKADYKQYKQYKKALRSGFGKQRVVNDRILNKTTVKNRIKDLEKKYPSFKKKYFASTVGQTALVIGVRDTLLYGDPLHTVKFYGGAAKLAGAYAKGKINNRPKFDKSIALPKPKNTMVFDNDTGKWIKRKF